MAKTYQVVLTVVDDSEQHPLTRDEIVNELRGNDIGLQIQVESFQEMPKALEKPNTHLCFRRLTDEEIAPALRAIDQRLAR